MSRLTSFVAVLAVVLCVFVPNSCSYPPPIIVEDQRFDFGVDFHNFGLVQDGGSEKGIVGERTIRLTNYFNINLKIASNGSVGILIQPRTLEYINISVVAHLSSNLSIYRLHEVRDNKPFEWHHNDHQFNYTRKLVPNTEYKNHDRFLYTEAFVPKHFLEQALITGQFEMNVTILKAYHQESWPDTETFVHKLPAFIEFNDSNPCHKTIEYVMDVKAHIRYEMCRTGPSAAELYGNFTYGFGGFGAVTMTHPQHFVHQFRQFYNEISVTIPFYFPADIQNSPITFTTAMFKK